MPGPAFGNSGISGAKQVRLATGGVRIAAAHLCDFDAIGERCGHENVEVSCGRRRGALQLFELCHVTVERRIKQLDRDPAEPLLELGLRLAHVPDLMLAGLRRMGHEPVLDVPSGSRRAR